MPAAVHTLLALAALFLLALALGPWWLARDEARPAASTVARVESPGSGLVVEELAGRRRLVAGELLGKGAVVSIEGPTVPSNTVGVRDPAVLRLTDGILVRLAVDSRLALAGPSSLRLGRGAVYLDTALGTDGVVVTTALGSVRDLGTRFTVWRTEQDTLRVDVWDGRIEVEAIGDRRVHLAEGGEELLLWSDGRAERRPITAADWSYLMGSAPEPLVRFEVDGRRLGEFLAWVSAETGWRIRYEDAALAASAPDIVLHGSVGDLPADQALHAVLPGAGLEGEVAGDTLWLFRVRTAR